MLTQSELKKVLSYNPDTGIFTRISATNKVRIGDIAGTKHVSGYMQICIKRKLYKSHRLAWLYIYGEFPVKQIDHINRVKDDNRIINLRLASPSENSCNQEKRPNNKSGFKGVSICKNGKYEARSCYNGKHVRFTGFKTAKDASIAYNRYAKEHHGVFYYQN